jgi:predicted DNA-binding transcriptional regulator YafY
VRADRLVATLLVLQARGRVTAAELADELEVSVKTARRDLEALSMAGIPVYSQPGRNGGWELIGGARTDLSGLNADEARTLFLLAGPSAAVTPEAKTALRKLVQALPETFRTAAEAAASAVVLDPARWGGSAPQLPRHLDVLRRAVVDGVQVRLGYLDRSGIESERMIHPLGLVEKASIWYLVAGTDRGQRTFRLSRIRSVAVTDEPAVRPPDFDLAAAWEAIVTTVEERRASTTAVVRVGRAGLFGLRASFATHCHVVAEPDDDHVDVEVGAPSAERIARTLAGWGDMAEVLHPPEVRAELARLGAELVRAYTP